METKSEEQRLEILPYLNDLQMDDCEEYVLTAQALTNFLLELNSNNQISEDDILFVSFLASQIRIHTVRHLKNKIAEEVIEAVKKAMYNNL